jgi:hypothetical protein
MFFETLQQIDCVIKVLNDILASECSAKDEPEMGIVLQYGYAMLPG